MLSFSGTLKVFVALEACDMRKSFNGLYTLASERLGEDPRQGALFVFSNRRHDRIKILYWDGTGLWVLTKRLEQGTFAWPKAIEPGTAPSCACDRKPWPCSPMEWNCAEPDCAPGMNGRGRKYFTNLAQIF